MASVLWYFRDDGGKSKGPVTYAQLLAVLLLGDRYIREAWDEEWHRASEYLSGLTPLPTERGRQAR